MDEKKKKDIENVCRYCGNTFRRLDLHEPSCRVKSANVENENAEDEENERNGVCDYLGKTFKRLDLHEPHCRSKSANVENENAEDEENERKYVCDYCGKTCKRLDVHEPSCRSKSANVKNENAEDEENERKYVCDYCGKTFKRLDLHEPSCRLKSANVKNENAEDEENKRKCVCDYCGITFKRLDLHEPSCRRKSANVENESLFENHEPEVDPLLPAAKEIHQEIYFNEFCKSVQLKRVDISLVTNINNLMNNILERVKCLLPLSWDQFNSGSYYSRVKVSKPDEFDYMLYPKIVQCEIRPYDLDPCFCHVFVTNKDALPYDFQKILTAKNELIPSKFKKFTFKLFDELAHKRNLTIINNKTTSPAYTVTYKYTTTIDSTTTTTSMEADIDWVPSLLVNKVPEIYMEWESKMISINGKKEGKIFVVPKKKIVGDKEVEVWRLSYSFFEKEIIRKYCKSDERTIIRIIKKILEEVKEENSVLCSYHIVTSCLHLFHETEERPKLREYTLNGIDSLIGQLKVRRLPHFFVKTVNLLADVKESECTKFIQRLNYYKQKWTVPK